MNFVRARLGYGSVGWFVLGCGLNQYHFAKEERDTCDFSHPTARNNENSIENVSYRLLKKATTVLCRVRALVRAEACPGY